MDGEDTPQFLYRIKPSRPEMSVSSTPEEDRIVGRHFEYLERLIDRGVVLLAGRTLNDDPSGFGIVVFTASSEAEARRLMEEDPAVEAGLFRAELFPYRVALVSEKILDKAGRAFRRPLERP